MRPKRGEAIGSATDILMAYREGAFAGSPRPWVGYFMLLEDSPKSRAPVSLQQPHFPVFREFHGTSYAERYHLLCKKLVRERLYHAAYLLLSNPKDGLRGAYSEPSRGWGSATSPRHSLRTRWLMPACSGERSNDRASGRWRPSSNRIRLECK